MTFWTLDQRVHTIRYYSKSEQMNTHSLTHTHSNTIIMNGYECDGTYYFNEVKDGMLYSTRRSKVEYNISSFTE